MHIHENRYYERGLVRGVILLVVAFIIAAIAGFDIADYIDVEFLRTVTEFIRSTAETVWVRFLETPVMFVWNEILLGVVWEGILKAYYALTGTSS